jgi:hypothetical protein
MAGTDMPIKVSTLGVPIECFSLENKMFFKNCPALPKASCPLSSRDFVDQPVILV